MVERAKDSLDLDILVSVEAVDGNICSKPGKMAAFGCFSFAFSYSSSWRVEYRKPVDLK